MNPLDNFYLDQFYIKRSLELTQEMLPTLINIYKRKKKQINYVLRRFKNARAG